MSTNDQVGFDRLPILGELREQLNEHYRASISRPRAHPRLVRSRRWRPLALLAVLVLGGATGALAAAGVFQSPTVIQRYNQSVTPVILRAMNSPLCARPHVAATTTSTAPASLLSSLGVLRRPSLPGGLRDVLPHLVTPGTSLYVRYVRFARSADGFDFYVFVGTSFAGTPSNISRCTAAVTANFTRELPHLKKSLRADATQIFDAALSAQRANWSRAKAPFVGVGLSAISMYAAGNGFGGGVSRASQVDQGIALGEGGAATGSGPNTSFVDGLVPDSVASLTLHYTAGPLGGFSHKHAVAANITTKPVDNVFVAIVPRATGNALPSTITWRGASGTTIKTIHEP
ncbi:MAG TPA: hypothetical protein VGG41_06855 [Solirubrobacteraceae bacterium]|jgi:hypothetical protein